MSFSKRHGYGQIRQVVQHESMEAELKIGIWNVIFQTILGEWEQTSWAPNQRRLAQLMWRDFFKLNLRTLSYHPYHELAKVEELFLSFEWFRVYDFVEFLAQNADILGIRTVPMFAEGLNIVLTREMAAYRLVGSKVVEITSQGEIASIEQAQSLSGLFSPVSQHIDSALRLLSDRTNPDYRNSIKESISAVESICRLATGRGTLSGALAVLPKKGITVHSAILDAFKKLYGYTSDADGIRHALLDQDSLDQEDAKFMLVTCSAFINLVRAREVEISKAPSSSAV